MTRTIQITGNCAVFNRCFNCSRAVFGRNTSVVMLAILIVPIILFNRSQAKELEGKI